MHETETTIEISLCQTCGPSSQPKNFRQRFVAQFGRPEGFWGRLAGWIMAHRPSNRRRNYWAVSLLDIQRNDRILEIGFGPGLAIERASQIAAGGLVVGVDYSETMLHQAQNRNARAIREGRVILLLASASALPSFPEPFDKVLAVNSVQFWPDRLETLKEIRNRLKLGGRIALAYQPRHRGATEEDARRTGEEIIADLARAGFSRCRLEVQTMKPVSVVCALGVK